ncbi:hypothetical protein JY651_27925 [Pyxidicoccus parkwayensis]|uniref:Lipoprotein n=1 Tax=Pyxidicoccus parkwayensis TaxID=2813578 RepID=A0ABX7NKK8_9BACT|nr:hypothetical protein [Pyxidicoccus parkwaysis]QSQ19173.1 hypothetical protein JY651_27925 [Pyxidicoccus parkwaysis]
MRAIKCVKVQGWVRRSLLMGVSLGIMGLTSSPAVAQVQPPPPCHPNPRAEQDRDTVAKRGDVVALPGPLKDRLLLLAERPHSVLPLQVYAEADSPSQLFQYYLLNTHGFERNVFVSVIPGVNDTAMKTATGPDCGLPTLAAVRLALEPKPGLPTDPNDVRAFIDVFTDISGLFVINNESGWYEGWMIHDLVVPEVAPPRPDGRAQFGTITAEDAAALAKMGDGQNVPGNIFTMDGDSVRFPSEDDRFPRLQTNVVPIQLSMGAYNSLQQSDAHAYWEFNYTTNWIHPLYELPFTGGFPDTFGGSPDAFQDGEIGLLSSLVPGSGPLGVKNKPQIYGDNPNRPRDPDLFDADVDSQREFRQRFIPSGLANEVFLDVYARPASFMPGERDLNRRLFLAYAAEVARVDTNRDGVVSAAEGDVDTASDGFPDNSRLFIPATQFNRFAVTREINDGYLAPRFAPSQRAWLLTGNLRSVRPAVPASEGRDADDR